MRLRQLREKQLTCRCIFACNLFACKQFLAKTQPLTSQINAHVVVWVAANNVLSYRGAQKRQLPRINMTGGKGAVATNLCCGIDHVVTISG